MRSRPWYVAVVGLAFAACGGDPPPPPPPAPAPQPVAARPAPPADDAAARARAAEAERQRRAAELASMRTTLAEMIFFDYDRTEIRADSRAILDRKARILRDQPTVSIRIEGHADERGSTEYNLALGSRRADAVRAYLTSVGINASRVQTTTMGEARPLANGSGEANWSRNRRAEFVVTAGLTQ
jgi:peptidoglycan-associated lipoprotein